MRSDSQLLEEFIGRHDQAAFAEFVQRHSGLVYQAALRQLHGDIHRAEEVAASVFADAARKANRLSAHPAITAWLHKAVRFAAGKVLRTESHRQRKLEALVHQNDTEGTPPDAWRQLFPVIDTALDRLGEVDRAAVLLRYFEGQSFAAVGAALNLTENSARMRVNRALDKLRKHFHALGLPSIAVALEQTLAARPIENAPAHFAAQLSVRALAQAVSLPAAAGLSTLSTVLPTATLIAAAGLVLTLSVATWSWQRAHDNQVKLESIQRTAADAESRIQRANAAREQSLQAQLPLAAELARLKDLAQARRRAQDREDRARQEFANWDQRGEGEKFMERHPEVRAALRDYAAARFRWSFGPLVASLHLTSARAAQVENIVQHGAAMGVTASGDAYFAGREFMLSESGLKSDSDSSSVYSGQQSGLSREVQSALGQWWQAEPQRDTVTNLAASFWDSPTALTAEQATQLVQALSKPKQSAPPSSFLSADQLAGLEQVQTEHADAFQVLTP